MSSPRLVDFEVWHAGLPYDPIYISDYDTTVEEDIEALNNLLYVRYERNAALNGVPSCACGQIQGRVNEGKRCAHCGHECREPFNSKIEPVLWSKVPDDIDAFVNPLIWTILDKHMKFNGNSALYYVTDPYYALPAPNVPKALKLKALVESGKLSRGINYFVEHFDEVIQLLLEHKIINVRLYEESGLREMWQENRNAFFTSVLPVPNRNLIVVEKNSDLLDTDVKQMGKIDAYLLLNSLHHDRAGLSTPRKESNIVKFLDKISDFYITYLPSKALEKKGIFRKHVIGSRLNFTARAVISSLHGPHNHQELHIPWGIANGIFKQHVQSVLMNHFGLLPDEILRLQYAYARTYNETLEKALNMLIDSSPYYFIDGTHAGFPCLFARNPTLKRASIQLFYITKIKSEHRENGEMLDNTVSFSPLVVADNNADYDGDELNMTLILDKTMHDYYKHLSPHFSVLDIGRPWEINRHVGMPAPQLSTLGNFISVSN